VYVYSEETSWHANHAYRNGLSYRLLSYWPNHGDTVNLAV
jgi:hypothetical protein